MECGAASFGAAASLGVGERVREYSSAAAIAGVGGAGRLPGTQPMALALTVAHSTLLWMVSGFPNKPNLSLKTSSVQQDRPT